MLVVLALCFASCESKNVNKSQDNLSENSEVTTTSFWKTLDLCYIEGGELFFYSVNDGAAAQFVNETDSILDMLYSKKDGMLYYNVVKDDNLVLKCLDLNDADPMPEQVLDWDVPVNVGEHYYPQQYGNMYFNYEGTQIALERDVNWFAGMYYNLAVYDCASKTVKTYELYRTVNDEEGLMYLEDLPDESGFDRWGSGAASDASNNNRFKEVNFNIYYIGDGKMTCLTDQIDFVSGFGFDLEEGYELDVLGTDPTEKKVLMAAHMFMGDGEIGFYIVSSLDGKMQMELPGSSYGETDPQWLPDGSLVFPSYLEGVDLYMLEPDNNLRFIAGSDIFCVLH